MADVRLGDAVTHGGRSRRITVTLVVEFLVIVTALTMAVLFAQNSSTKNGPLGVFWGSDTQASARDQANAVSVAQQFVLKADALTPTNVQAYISSVLPLMTTKGQTDFTNEFAQFNQVAGAVLAQLTQDSPAAAMPSAGAVQFAALEAYAVPTATVIVAHDVLYGGVKPADCATKRDYCQSQRWSVSMRKINGAWLVDTFTPVS